MTRVRLILVGAAAIASLACTAMEALTAAIRLHPAAVWTPGEAVHAGWAVLVQGQRITAVGPAAEIAPTARRRGDRPAGRDPDPRADGPALPRAAAPLQRDPVGRSGAQGARALPHPARRQAGRGDADGWLHHPARPGHRGRGLCRRGGEAGDQRGHDPRATAVRRHPRHRGGRLLRSGRAPVPSRPRPAAGRAGGQRSRRHRQRGAPAGRARRRLDQALCRLSRRPERGGDRDLLGRRDEGCRRDRPLPGPPGGRARRDQRGHAPRGAGRRRHHRARLWRDGGDLQADGRPPYHLYADPDRGGRDQRIFPTLCAWQDAADAGHDGGGHRVSAWR